MASAAVIPEQTDTVQFIVTATLQHYGTLPAEWYAIRTRQRYIVTARHIFMYMLRKYTDYSLSAIGAICGRRDHTTVIYACNNVDNLKLFDRNMAQVIARIESAVAGYTADGMSISDDVSTFWPRGHASAHLIETHF
jgi:chromosomal replication initiator protein